MYASVHEVVSVDGGSVSIEDVAAFQRTEGDAAIQIDGSQAECEGKKGDAESEGAPRAEYLG